MISPPCVTPHFPAALVYHPPCCFLSTRKRISYLKYLFDEQEKYVELIRAAYESAQEVPLGQPVDEPVVMGFPVEYD